MITVEDALIALSNSGKTAELSDIVVIKLKRIPSLRLHAMLTACFKAADVSLVVPDSPEACPLNLAPTTSTTVMLALGDAIAVTCLKGGFSPADFRLLHPGGHLGSRLIRAKDIMRSGSELPLVSTKTPMTETILEMTAKQLGCVGVLSAEGQLVGVITTVICAVTWKVISLL